MGGGDGVVGIKMSWVEKNRKNNNRGGGGGGLGGDYSGLESKQELQSNSFLCKDVIYFLVSVQTKVYLAKFQQIIAKIIFP